MTPLPPATTQCGCRQVCDERMMESYSSSAKRSSPFVLGSAWHGTGFEDEIEGVFA